MPNTIPTPNRRERDIAIATLKAYTTILQDRNIIYEAMPSDDDLDVMPVSRIQLHIRTIERILRTPS